MAAAGGAVEPLSAVRPGMAVRIERMADEDVLALAEVGLRSGTPVRVERRLPFGGPVLLDVGPARIAVARAVAARTLVVPAS